MRSLISNKDEIVIPRADEVDWMPLTNSDGETWHTFVNDEDMCRSKKEKMMLRRHNRRQKLVERDW